MILFLFEPIIDVTDAKTCCGFPALNMHSACSFVSFPPLKRGFCQICKRKTDFYNMENVRCYTKNDVYLKGESYKLL